MSSSGPAPVGRVVGPLTGLLKITVHGARDLASKQLIGTMDPYITAKLKSEVLKSAVHKDGGRTPVWNHTFVMNLRGYEEHEILHFEVMNKETLSDSTIGLASIELKDIVTFHNVRRWYQLVHKHNFSHIAGAFEATIDYQGTGVEWFVQLQPQQTAATQPAAQQFAAAPAPTPTPTPAAVPVQPAPPVQPTAAPAYQSPPPAAAYTPQPATAYAPPAAAATPYSPPAATAYAPPPTAATPYQPPAQPYGAAQPYQPPSGYPPQPYPPQPYPAAQPYQPPSQPAQPYYPPQQYAPPTGYPQAQPYGYSAPQPYPAYGAPQPYPAYGVQQPAVVYAPPPQVVEVIQQPAYDPLLAIERAELRAEERELRREERELRREAFFGGGGFF